ncbi:OmpH family outer membrane protein [Alloalcanivorax gelatiniphagus]|uniref:OmpH family outer membrane protein n=1 Tax=Alloalcanivorax gelatiniphagus TaxID=1194167 RepID=A0ABY2XNM1_9GAMM|nr:OmpH family outer membrane protein [Alloalcanivorax gelatiniphagus]TMW13106.1 OmpH family outer membrane protein [Alloalcanivorax gelatiniphagus]|tara:strand:+ start:9060 stop:9554 length:495 start_codon:yes stop_codon:yes gene_type:complete
MKKTLLAALLMLPVLAAAEQRIGVVDPIGALQQASEFQDRFGKLESSLKDEQARLDRLGGEVEKLRGRLEKEGMTMSEDERQDLQTKGQQKMIELQNLRQSAQRKLNKGQQEILEVMEPKLKQAVETVAERENLDVVMNAQAVVYVQSNMDITGAVTKQLNSMK